MGGDKIELVKEAVNHAIACLGPDDRVSLVIFDNEIEVLQPLAPATMPTREAIRQRLRQVEARGGTNLSDGWLTGCQQLANEAPATPGTRLQRAILLTDGQANDGITDHTELATHAAALRRMGIATTAMGVGHGFDEVLLTTLVEAGGGNFKYIEHPGQFAGFFEAEIGGLTEVAALRPQLELTLPRGLRARLLNRFPFDRQGKTITVELRDMLDRDSIELVFIVTHRGNLDETSRRLTGSVRAIDPQSGVFVTLAIDPPPVTFVPDPDALRAPVNHAVTVARAHEQALLDQREALRLDREGRFEESRRAFAVSHQRLFDADASAAASGYAGMSEEQIVELRDASARSADLAAAPAAPLGEHIHKERAAHHSNRSRGGRRERPTND
jgi:Ca-activated chloride channel family protein